MSDHVHEIAQRFEGVQRQRRDLYSAWCPVCDTDSVMISNAGYGVARISCPNCDEDQVLQALKLTREDLIGAGGRGHRGESSEVIDQLPLSPIKPDVSEFPSTPFDHYIDALKERTQAPHVLCAQSLLAAITLSHQHLADVEIPGIGGEGARRPLSNFFVTIARSGERKSTADSIALEGIEHHRKNLEKAYSEEKVAYEQRVKEIERVEARGGEPGLELGDPPKLPVLLVREPNQEGLFRSFKEGQLSQGLFNDEAGSFLGGHGMSRDNKQRTCSSLNTLWDGKPLDRVRAREYEVLRGRRLSVHLMIQPHASEQLVGDAQLRDLGFTARCLCAEPDSTMGNRPINLDALPSAESMQLCDDFARRTRQALEIKPRVEDGNLAPRALRLSDDAVAFWVEFYNIVERALLGRYRSIQGFAAKAAEHALRLAGVMALWSNPRTDEIGLDPMITGIELAQYYLGQQLALEVGRPSEQDEAAELLLEWMRENDKTVISVPDVCRFGPSRLRKRDAALDAVETCIKTGWLSDSGKGEVDGVRRKQTYTLVTPDEGATV